MSLLLGIITSLTPWHGPPLCISSLHSAIFLEIELLHSDIVHFITTKCRVIETAEFTVSDEFDEADSVHVRLAIVEIFPDMCKLFF